MFAEGVDNVITRTGTVADGTPLSKGQLMIYGDATRTIVGHGTNPTVRSFGYTTMSKDANDGITEVGCQRTGVVIATADGVITTGDLVVAGAVANRLRRMNTTAAGLSYQELQALVGRALENAADGGRFRVALTLG